MVGIVRNDVKDASCVPVVGCISSRLKARQLIKNAAVFFDTSLRTKQRPPSEKEANSVRKNVLHITIYNRRIRTRSDGQFVANVFGCYSITVRQPFDAAM